MGCWLSDGPSLGGPPPLLFSPPAQHMACNDAHRYANHRQQTIDSCKQFPDSRFVHTATSLSQDNLCIFDLYIGYIVLRAACTLDILYSSSSRHFGLHNFRRPFPSGSPRINSELPPPTDFVTLSTRAPRSHINQVMPR